MTPLVFVGAAVQRFGIFLGSRMVYLCTRVAVLLLRGT